MGVQCNRVMRVAVHGLTRGHALSLSGPRPDTWLLLPPAAIDQAKADRKEMSEHRGKRHKKQTKNGGAKTKKQLQEEDAAPAPSEGTSTFVSRPSSA